MVIFPETWVKPEKKENNQLCSVLNNNDWHFQSRAGHINFWELFCKQIWIEKYWCPMQILLGSIIEIIFLAQWRTTPSLEGKTLLWMTHEGSMHQFNFMIGSNPDIKFGLMLNNLPKWTGSTIISLAPSSIVWKTSGTAN